MRSVALLVVAGCATIDVDQLAEPGPRVAPEDVVIARHAPAAPAIRVALMTNHASDSVDAIEDQMRDEASKLGCHVLVIDDIDRVLMQATHSRTGDHYHYDISVTASCYRYLAK